MPQHVTHHVTEIRVTSQEMNRDRGTPVSVPEWWMEDLRRAMAERRLNQAKLAALMADTEDRNAPSFKAAKTRLSRFLRRQFQSEETAQELRVLLGLRMFQIKFDSPEDADAVEQARKEGWARVAGAIQVRRLLEDLESGEASLDEAIQRSGRSGGAPVRNGRDVTKVAPSGKRSGTPE